MLKRDALRAAKASLVGSDLLNERHNLKGLPDPIERSWRRSVWSGVSPEQTALTDPAAGDPDELLLSAASPVLTTLAEDVADMAVAVVLSDSRGRIIERIALNAAQRAQLDHLGVLVGSDFAEQTVGTNGLGSVLEERAPLFVRGAEHFIDALEEIACAGVPILDPGTRRVRGSLSLTCAARGANPLMLTLAHAAVRDIQHRLADGHSRSLLDIASAFAQATRRGTGALALLTPSTVLANTAGLPYVSPANHAAIWDRLTTDGVDQPAVLRIELIEGAVELRAQRVHVTDEQLAFQVAFAPVRRQRRTAAESWHPLANVDAALRSLAAHSPVVVISGEPGTGKAFVARRMLDAGAGSWEELDQTTQRVSSAAFCVDSARSAIDAGSHVLLRHVETVPSSEHAHLHDLLEAAARPADDTRTRLVLTVDSTRAEPGLTELLERSASVIELPALSAMRTTVPLLVQRMIEQYPTGRRCTMSPAAMRALLNRSWPGNISQLRHVIHGLVSEHAGQMVRESDIVDAPLGRVLTVLERSERSVIVAALREAQGNRAAAARMLGIGRTTLYRKLRSLRIDDEERVS